MKYCNIQEKCGGCNFLDVLYEEQLSYKTKYIRELLNFESTDIIGMNNPFNYRNKGKYAFKNGKMGFFEEGTHKIVYGRCVIQNDIINEVANTIYELVLKYKISMYNEDTKKGFLRYVVIRYGVHTDELMVIFVTKNGKISKRDLIIKELIEKYPNVKSIVQNINEKENNAILGDKIYKLYGRDYIIDKIGELKFKISPLSFYQVNSIQMEKLYDIAIKEAILSGNETVYDLYSGIGTISLCVAKKARKVYAIEIVKDAVKDAIENAKINNIKNVSFICGKVEEKLPSLVNKSIADVVFVDPPRAGLDTKTISTLLEIDVRKIVYISCNPLTLKEDIAKLSTKYNLVKVCPVDMFPHTKHIECVCVLELKMRD